MVKYKGIATYEIGGTSYAFTGRTPKTIADEADKSSLLATGCFTKDGSGDLIYSVPVLVKDDAGAEQPVDASSELQGVLTDFDDNANVVEAV